jgi:hypothetical protein
MSVVGVDFGNSDCYIAQGEGSCFGGWAALQALAVAFTLEFPITFALRSQARWHRLDSQRELEQKEPVSWL